MLPADNSKLQSSFGFTGGDPIPTHTLTFAAYEIIHVISEKRNRTDTLIFDSSIIKDEYRKDWNRHIRKRRSIFQAR
jgi:hypothetical protein